MTRISSILLLAIMLTSFTFEVYNCLTVIDCELVELFEDSQEEKESKEEGDSSKEKEYTLEILSLYGISQLFGIPDNLSFSYNQSFHHYSFQNLPDLPPEFLS